jgi:hypothetical protein
MNTMDVIRFILVSKRMVFIAYGFKATTRISKNKMAASKPKRRIG